MKKKAVVLASFAAAVLFLGFAGSADATPFGGTRGDGARIEALGLFGNHGLFTVTSPSVGFLDRRGGGFSGFGRLDFVWTIDRDEVPRTVGRDGLLPIVHHNLPHFGTIRNPRHDPAPAIPEPSAALIFAAGLAVAGWRRRS